MCSLMDDNAYVKYHAITILYTDALHCIKKVCKNERKKEKNIEKKCHFVCTWSLHFPCFFLLTWVSHHDSQCAYNRLPPSAWLYENSNGNNNNDGNIWIMTMMNHKRCVLLYSSSTYKNEGKSARVSLPLPLLQFMH